MGYTIDIDVGGTFTDCFVRDERRFVTAKVPTTPFDLGVCFGQALEAAARPLGVDLGGLLSQTDVVRYSTTIGINALLERTGPAVGLITTRGFEDTIFVGRSRQWGDGLPIEETRDLAVIAKPAPLVPKDLVVGVRERIDCFGRILLPLDPADVLEQVQTLIDRGARALVVSLLWSFANPTHELQVLDLIRREYPDIYLGNIPVICSHQVSPRAGEYARTMTAVVDAYTHQALTQQLWSIGEMTRERGYTRPLMLVHNTGGCKKLARTRAIDTQGAGPAAGVYGTAALARLYNADRVVFTDVGGTSFDIGVVTDGEVSSYDFRPIIDRWRVQGSFVETKSIGAGGGSIAWINPALGRLQVGPRSAGSMPGPAAYDQGGDEPTVTDADLVLGLIDPAFYLGGQIPLNADAAREAIETRIARPLGLDVREAAWRIRRLVDATMGQEIFKELALKGRDPRGYTIFAAGGAGPTHACGYADFVGARRIVTFPFSSVFCAFGASTMDVMHIYEKTRRLSLTRFMQPGIVADVAAFNHVVDELRDAAERDFRLEGFAPSSLRLELELDMRYGTQLNFTRVRAPQLRLETEADVRLLCEAFNLEYGRRFTPEAAFPQAGIDVEEFHLKAWAPSRSVAWQGHEPAGADPVAALVGRRSVYWGPESGALETPVYRHELLQCGHEVAGPAILEAQDTTIVVEPGWAFGVDRYLNGVLVRTAEPTAATAQRSHAAAGVA